MAVTGTAEFEIGEELDDIELTWNDSDGVIRNFASGWTFEFKLGLIGSAANLTKTTGITPAATAPNVTIALAANDLDTIPAGDYIGQVRARRTSDNKDLITQFPVTIKAVVT